MKMTLIRLMKAYDICQKADEHILQKKAYEQEIEEMIKRYSKKVESRVLLDIFIVLVSTGLLSLGSKGALIYIISMLLFNLFITVDILSISLCKKKFIEQKKIEIELEERESVRIICEHENELNFLPNEFRNIDAIEYMLGVLKNDDAYSLEFIYRMCRRHLHNKKRQFLCNIEQI
ncbi:hypothetical protein [Lachnobacterium bovis]|uniref:Uncharacterized protein n=1 Tax=Lachnobacterium bovis TaxID=140626 RepID=A0A1H9PGH1_9FIRM|nr:hypothetical protein [Lachnobacterium bovis]SER47247.1 hypothetical protein SAMN02910429_00253 [Lachnobacterium bovis]